MRAWWRLLGLAALTCLFVLPSLARAGIRIAVAPFDNASSSSEFEGLSVGLQSMVTTDLAMAESVEVVERARLQDLIAEMQLADTGVMDPSTAARVGKVVGATHVVTGSFTVANDQMRIDARLANVETATIQKAAQRTGPQEEFFDLEKQVVRDLLDLAGVQLSAKERHKVDQIHTFEFDSFVKFSEGVALGDADRFEEAVQILEQVSRSDPDFGLASLTLTDIQSAAKEAARRAEAARIVSAEQAFVARQAEARREAELLEKLRAVSKDTSEDWKRRMAAELLTVVGLVGGNHGGFNELKSNADRFALERLGEQAYQRMWAEMQPRMPEWFPTKINPSPFFSEKFGFERVLDGNLRNWFTGTNHNYLLSECKRATSVGEHLDKLWVPPRRQLELQHEVLTTAKGCLDERRYQDAMIDVAEGFRDLGYVGRSTVILQELSRASGDERVLSKIARELEYNVARQKEVDTFPVGSPAHEILMHKAASRGNYPGVSELKRADAGKRLWRAHWRIRGRIPVYDPLFINGLPAWAMAGKSEGYELATGPRTGSHESRSIRHYRDLRNIGSYSQRQAEPPSMLVIGGAVRKDLTAKVTLDFTPASDWWPNKLAEKPAGWAPLAERPSAGLLVAVRELMTRPVCDPADDTSMTPVPTTGIGAIVHEGQLMIAEITETWPDEPDRCNMSRGRGPEGLAIGKIYAKRPMSKKRAELTVSVRGNRVEARAGGARVSTTLPEARSGFVALYADGEGYVELADPSWE